MLKKIILVIVIILLVAGGVFWYKNHYKKGTGSDAIALADKQRNLTEEQKQIYAGRIKEAEDYLKTLKPTQPGYKMEVANVYIYLGQQYFGLGLLQKSKEMYNKAMLEDPGNDQALIALSLTFMDAGDVNSAAASLEKAKEINPGNPDTWLRYIQIRKDLQTPSPNIKALYDEALSKTKNYIDVLTSYAQYSESLGEINKAISLWQEALKQNPSGASIYNAEIDRLKRK